MALPFPAGDICTFQKANLSPTSSDLRRGVVPGKSLSLWLTAPITQSTSSAAELLLDSSLEHKHAESVLKDLQDLKSKCLVLPEKAGSLTSFIIPSYQALLKKLDESERKKMCLREICGVGWPRSLLLKTLVCVPVPVMLRGVVLLFLFLPPSALTLRDPSCAMLAISSAKARGPLTESESLLQRSVDFAFIHRSRVRKASTPTSMRNHHSTALF